MDTFPTKPTLSRGESPSLYKIEAESNSTSSESDGGYEFRRRRFTRARRSQIETGFIGLSHADFLTLDAFWEDHQEDKEFLWFDQIQGRTRHVRFDEFKPEYIGLGQNRMWTIKIKLSEV